MLPTASSIPLPARPSPTPLTSRPPLQSPAEVSMNDITSDTATAVFVRRILCAHQHLNVADRTVSEAAPIGELLPPLTSSNDIDLQLYAFVAILIKEYVNPWYGRITSEHVFVDEIVQIIAHCTRGLEERLRKIDLETLLLDDLPGLLDAHVDAYRISAKAAASYSRIQARAVYHTLRPHPALSPVPDEQEPATVLEQQQNDQAYRHLLAQGVLAVLLPTEDLRNPCLRALMSEILADLILGNLVSGRLSDGVFLYDGIRKAVLHLQFRTGRDNWISDTQKPVESKDRLARYGLLAEKKKARKDSSLGSRTISEVFWLIAQYAFLTFQALRVMINALAGSRTLSERESPNTTSSTDESRAHSTSIYITSTTNSTERHNRNAIVEYKLWHALANLVSLPTIMPWMYGYVSMIEHFLLNGPQKVGRTNSRLDRLLSYHLLKPLAQPSRHLPTLLLTLRTSLFPDNTVTPFQPALPHSKLASRRAASFALLNLLPAPLARLYLLGSHEQGQDADAEVETMVEGVGRVLDVLGGDEYMTRHLVYAVLEKVVAVVVPELGCLPSGAGKGVAEVLRERGIGGGGDEDG